MSGPRRRQNADRLRILKRMIKQAKPGEVITIYEPYLKVVAEKLLEEYDRKDLIIRVEEPN